MNLQPIGYATSPSLAPKISELSATVLDQGVQTLPATGGRKCHGTWYVAVLVLPAVVFVAYLGINAKKNLRKLWNGRSYVMISYFALLWFACSLNLAWCCLQAWQCSPGKEVAWNFLSLITGSAMLCLEVSLMAFLLQDSYASGLETLSRTFAVSGIIVGVDMLFKGIYVFGFGIPLFIGGDDSTQRVKWGLWIIHKLLLTAVYGYILFVHFSKWREKLPRGNAVELFACGLAVIGAGVGIWLYDFMVVCYHSLYLPFLYMTFLADFFQEEHFLLENAYYSEMKDAGFFDADWE
ncbi:protein CANDIDATE G-PROTEIN COUPLED RECEPTOR 2 isoform X2 [Jatropha curcas]|uniref:protein CANDIDATE G-PROTEIN COUPLED RECEPTOR 2 isoform X2 n=1 Tax=Jatropha curcas TaxID=180498 RepID=UPI001894A946|nr:protein CANDIDATE G-PROTEIN COUPLED RECEPTOR 2 isoform X2 [Jatropha curcas]